MLPGQGRFWEMTESGNPWAREQWAVVIFRIPNESGAVGMASRRYSEHDPCFWGRREQHLLDCFLMTDAP